MKAGKIKNLSQLKKSAGGWRSIASAVVLGLATATSAGTAHGQTAARDVKIGFASGSLTGGSLRIANEMGLYQRYNLNPTFVMADGGNVAVAGMIGGSFDAVVANFGDVLTAQANGQKVSVVTSVYNGFGGTLVLSKEIADKLPVSADAPVKDRFKALEGLLIAVTTPASAYTLAFKAAAAGMESHNIQTTFVTAPNQPATMASGAIQGYVSSAPYWISDVISGKGVIWVSGPRGDIPFEYRPSNTLTLLMLAPYAEQNPDLVKGLRGVLSDFAVALKERPDEVKAAAAKIFPNLQKEALDLFFEYEADAWIAKPPTPEEIAHDIAFNKAGGLALDGLESIDPASLVLP
ncbi:ABC transporter substrate-binding protein [Sinorhizobium medicae]|uniref:ABC transporter substrate-binding protein n=1 Tax=Sinorhizobium medicae TaxID=110321 RepID=UPI000FDA39F7|nr:ABC transporter substrate-binding protein [Sinorhizobium medicae]RVO69935.1 ABC transporter substrate-binding protein [Sinorhizobium medicae]